MRLTRIYQPIAALQTEQLIPLSTEAAHYLTRVLRLSEGAHFIVFNDQGGEFVARLVRNKKNVCAYLQEYCATTRESNLKIYLGQAVSSIQKMDYTVQKTVELGLTSFSPILSEYCQVHLSEERWPKRLRHWQAVAVSACQQSGRTLVPNVTRPYHFLEWVQTISADIKYILHPNAATSLCMHVEKPCTLALLIGPEAGWSPIEYEQALTHHFTAITLGPRVLRTETASVSAVAVLQSLFGDLMIKVS